MYETDDIEKQGDLLQQVAQLVDQQKIRSTLNQNLGKINASNLEKAHKLLESKEIYQASCGGRHR